MDTRWKPGFLEHFWDSCKQNVLWQKDRSVCGWDAFLANCISNHRSLATDITVSWNFYHGKDVQDNWVQPLYRADEGRHAVSERWGDAPLGWWGVRYQRSPQRWEESCHIPGTLASGCQCVPVVTSLPLRLSLHSCHELGSRESRKNFNLLNPC